MATTITANGINFPDGSAGSPSIGGTDTNTGLFTGSDIIGFSTGGSERLRVDSSGNLLFNGNGVVSVQSNSSSLFLGGGSVQPSETYLESGSLTGLKVNGSERMRVDSSGRVGIGTTSPTEFLQIHESQNNTRSQITFTNNSTGATVNDGLNIGLDGSQNAIIHQHESTNLIFGTSDTERMRIDSSGRVLVGTTTQNNNAALQVTTAQQVVASFEGTGVSDPQIYLGDDMSSPTNNAIIFGYDKADNRGYLTIGGDADTTLTISDGSLVGINTSANVEHFNVAGNTRLINPTGTTRRINALPSGSYSLGTSGGSAIAFHRISDGGGGSDEIAFETHWQGNRHAESARISKFGGITFNGDTAAANALDDYEEGTFTPRFQTSNGNWGGSMSNQSGSYTKIGNVVHVRFALQWGSVSGSGNFRITALPFTAANTASNEGGGATIGARSGFNYARLTSYFMLNNQQLQFQYVDSSGSNGSFDLSVGALASTGHVYCSGWYETA